MTEPFMPDGHYYSPIPNKEDQNRALEFARRDIELELSGINIDDAFMLKLWNDMMPHMLELPFSKDAAKGSSNRYHYNNNMFSYGDATVYFGMLANFRPRRIIEIGSGFSSALAIDAKENLGLETYFDFIEPFPSKLKTFITDRELSYCTIHECSVQDVDIRLFSQLERNDILFVDSSHVVKAGSDVCHEIFRILPQLAPGVIIHFHDCFWPFEYPEAWIRENRSWTELYFLRAFLMYNESFKIIFFNSYFARLHSEKFNQADLASLNPGGGLWLRREG
jgi:hypothetical protein